MPHQFVLEAHIVNGRQHARGGAVNEGSVNGNVYNGTHNNPSAENRRTTYTVSGGGCSIINGDLNGTQSNMFPGPLYPQGNFDSYRWGNAPPFQGPHPWDAYYTGRPHFAPTHNNPAITGIARRHSVRGQGSQVAIRSHNEANGKQCT
ncbi:hypothetical protein FA13DRAFT_1797019 [Coprinellus micaceus]|uniref:Uncharacterized protein n=1 Tax=Coprinellus micaceus TaxID=71717 RepID=A0A4Y7SSE7_COPMI|nr:hypothetical protein FA13DRAFT_1797019 [Coprinellus micaceus]